MTATIWIRLGERTKGLRSLESPHPHIEMRLTGTLFIAFSAAEALSLTGSGMVGISRLFIAFSTAEALSLTGSGMVGISSRFFGPSSSFSEKNKPKLILIGGCPGTLGDEKARWIGAGRVLSPSHLVNVLSLRYG
jgi:hypothetical protein